MTNNTSTHDVRIVVCMMIVDGLQCDEELLTPGSMGNSVIVADSCDGFPCMLSVREVGCPLMAMAWVSSNIVDRDSPV